MISVKSSQAELQYYADQPSWQRRIFPSEDAKFEWRPDSFAVGATTLRGFSMIKQFIRLERFACQHARMKKQLRGLDNFGRIWVSRVYVSNVPWYIIFFVLWRNNHVDVI